MIQRYVYMNGEFVREQDARISIYDSALMFGDMVFEMTRSFNRKHFKLKEHLERLLAGAKILEIPHGYTVEVLEKACYETSEKNSGTLNPGDEHRLMINLSRGPLGIYKDVFDGKIEPTLVIADFPLKWTVQSMAPIFDVGINCVIPAQKSIPAQYMDPKIKNRSRLYYQMANIEVSKVKGTNNWALLTDANGFITEGTGSNFFMVRNGELITPKGTHILRGISRQYIFDIAKELKIPCREADIEKFDVLEASEAFMAATPFCILPVTKLNGLEIGDGKPGTLAKILLSEWSKRVGVDIVEQIRTWHASMPTNDAAAVAPTPYAFQKNESK